VSSSKSYHACQQITYDLLAGEMVVANYQRLSGSVILQWQHAAATINAYIGNHLKITFVCALSPQAPRPANSVIHSTKPSPIPGCRHAYDFPEASTVPFEEYKELCSACPPGRALDRVRLTACELTSGYDASSLSLALKQQWLRCWYNADIQISW
jgi:hypothetical protein